MKDQLTISISTINGSKHWYFSKRMQRNLKTFLGLFVLTLAATAILINHLYARVDSAAMKQAQLTEHSRSMGEELSTLKALKSELENDLSEREERVQLVSERLGELEKVLGVDNHATNEDLDTRLDSAAITSNVRTLMLNQIPNGSPVGKVRLSSGFGKRIHPVTKVEKMHRGLDFAVNIGTKIYAPADGVVEVTRRSNTGSGNFLRLQHSFGFTSSYSHLKKFKVQSGQFVRKGDLIGISGNSGLSSGPHLHYEVRFVGRALNPKPFVDWSLNNFEDIFTKERKIRWESLIKTVEQRVAQQLQLSSPKAVLLAENSK
ncbi:M23 family peptidase [Vibrio parahaemolyticus]|uniref:M23 family metallopeptidase n=1 Tax=Vibrio parahaemolyticus TaxID=670 RepID=UPI001C82CA80|nr:M23 family metallopeptidase [Vibrio parahaemolyticus]EGQ8455093.1 peptidoglycan DD-metalloendopeptidase family protein [Vibrio parahaemolyticus]EGQ8461996.1 peptidoglycan DD-metalloendopeptidase family protein [Vibrio parahaemolyticus]EGQ9401495.1 M23 family metallopeptidase [Vibrio parahaemolyticus]EGR0275823.1 M23 family metallopeptidase [Vibrio parahaemolyticus]EGR0294960.1 M23 family metallopeptidase [Vibrio parahaemolyticus]